MSLLKLAPLFALLLLINIAAKAQNANIIVQPAQLQVVGDTVTINLWIQSAGPVTNLYAWSVNTNPFSIVEKTLTYNPASGYYTARFPFTGFPDDTLELVISGSPSISSKVYVIHDASLIPTSNPPQIVLEKPLAFSVAEPVLPIKAKVVDNTDSTRLVFTIFTPLLSSGTYTEVGSYWDSVNTDLDLSLYYGKGCYLLVHAIDSNLMVTALKPIPLYVESSPYLSKHFVSNGRILDFNYNKLLVIDNGVQSGPRIIDVPGGTSVTIPFIGTVNTGYLTPQGAVLSTNDTASSSLDSLYDYNNGSLFPVAVLKKGTLRVAGNYCTWTYGNSAGNCNISNDSLFLRNLVNKTDVLISPAAAYTVNGRPTINSLQADGSVLYIDSAASITRYMNGVYTMLFINTPCGQSGLANPVHDSVSYAYTYIDERMTRISWSRSLMSDVLAIERRPFLDYQVNGKYMAHINIPVANQGSAQVLRSDTSFNNALLTTGLRGGISLDLLSPTGDLMIMTDKRKMAFQTGGITELCSALGKTYYRDADWYLAIGNTLYKFNFAPSPDMVSNDTITMAMSSDYHFTKADFTGNFGPSQLMAVKITALPVHGTLKLDGVPVLLNDIIARADLPKLIYQPDAGFAATDTIQWNGSNGFYYSAASGMFKLVMVAPPSKPAITGVLTGYCDNQGAQKIKIANWPADAPITSVSAKLDAMSLAVNATDSSCTFNVNGLAAGAHTITVTFTNIAGTKDTVAGFNVTATLSPEVNVSANITNVVNLANPVILTAVNAAGGGTAPLYTFARDKGMTNLLQAEGTTATLTIDPSTLAIGDNKVYVRMKTSATCYTVQTNVDSILLRRDAATGIIDVDNPVQVITIFPNPFSSKISVAGLNSGKAYQIVLYNSRGQAVYASEVKNKRVLDIPGSGIIPGIYWISIYDAKKKLIGTEKVVKY